MGILKKLFGEGKIYVEGIAKRKSGVKVSFKGQLSYEGSPSTCTREWLVNYVTIKMMYNYNVKLVRIDRIDIIEGDVD